MAIEAILVLGLLVLIVYQFVQQAEHNRLLLKRLEDNTRVIEDLHKATQIQNDTFQAIIDHIIKNK
jgi:hypothetical protein